MKNSTLVEQVTRKLSLVISLIDDFTVKVPVGNINIRILGFNRKAIRNLSGYYIFTDLPASHYVITVDSDFYFPQELKITPEDLACPKPIFKQLTLKPNINYPFPEGTTMSRGVIEKQEYIPLKEAALESVMLPTKDTKKTESVAIAKVSQEGASKGQKFLHLTSIAGPILAGDKFLIKDFQNNKQEFIVIANSLPINPKSEPFKLVDELKDNYPHGTLLIPVTVTQTNEKGEFVIYFRTVRVKQFLCLLAIRYKNEEMKHEVLVNEGALISLGKVSFKST